MSHFVAKAPKSHSRELLRQFGESHFGPPDPH
jgi:hypothetical protein